MDPGATEGRPGDGGADTHDAATHDAATHDAFTYLGAILAGLQHAAPEASEHLARAMYELLLAARAVFESMSDAIAAAEGRERQTRIETIPIRDTPDDG